VRSCKLEMQDLFLGGSAEEPKKHADHRADLTEFLVDEINLSARHGNAELLCIQELECLAVLPLLEPFPDRSQRNIKHTAERTTAAPQPWSNVSVQLSYAAERLLMMLQC
jgi:hypothetical protein